VEVIMKKMLTAFYARPLALYLVLALIGLSAITGPAEAMLVPTSPDSDQVTHAVPSPERAADLAKAQKVLEMKAVQQRLQDYGLTPEETMARINALSDEQLHQFASNLDAVQAGGDVLGTLLAIVLIALLVVLIIYLLEGRIEIQRK
jgi:hypothetical protein